MRDERWQKRKSEREGGEYASLRCRCRCRSRSRCSLLLSIHTYTLFTLTLSLLSALCSLLSVFCSRLSVRMGVSCVCMGVCVPVCLCVFVCVCVCGVGSFVCARVSACPCQRVRALQRARAACMFVCLGEGCCAPAVSHGAVVCATGGLAW